MLDLLKCICIVVAWRSQLIFALKYVHTYEVTGISPQSMTFPQKLKGLVSWGLLELAQISYTQRPETYTLYPPLNRTFREPLSTNKLGQLTFMNVLKIEAARTLSDAAGAKSGTGSV